MIARLSAGALIALPLSLLSAHAAPCDPLVPTKAVALGIFNAVVSAKETAAAHRKFETIVESDDDSWQVSQSPRGANSVHYFRGPHGELMETVRVMEDGGGFEMRIDKCTGAISDAHWSR